LGMAIAAAVWWPALLYSAHTVRGGPWGGVSLQEVRNFSLGWGDLLATLWPSAVGFGGGTYWGSMRITDYPPYLGLVAAALAVLGIARAPDRDRGLVWLLISTIVVPAALALGTFLGPLYVFLHQSVPLISKFRVPWAGLILAQLAVALLAARALA